MANLADNLALEPAVPVTRDDRVGVVGGEDGGRYLGWRSSGQSSAALVLAPVLFVLLAMLSTAFNLFAFDDIGFSYLISTATPWRSVLVGKALVPQPCPGRGWRRRAGLAWLLLSDRVDPTVMALATLPIAGALAWALLRLASGRLERDPWRIHDALNR